MLLYKTQMSKIKLKGSRFLITQPMIAGINGSTTVTLELADYIQSKGGIVQVYTYYLGHPAQKFFEEKKNRHFSGWTKC